MKRLVLTLCGVIGIAAPARGADLPQIQQCIAKAAGFVRPKVKSATGGRKILMALALLKAGLPKESPEVQETLRDIRGQFEPGTYAYRPDGEHLYTASVSAVLMADTDPEANKPYLDSLANYIASSQRTDGGWDYPTDRGTNGDTSVTHYALLGLWSCARSGCEINPQVWANSIQWHMSKQNTDGGFGYCPGFMNGDGAGASVPNMSVNAVGSIAIAWMNLSTDLPSLDADEAKARKKEVVVAPPKPKNNDALEAVPVVEATPVADVGKIPSGAGDSMRRSYKWFANRFSVENNTTSNKFYYYYSLERMTALVNVKDIGGHDWYGECSDYLIANQNQDGSWTTPSTTGPDIDAAFVILSLVKSTAKLIKRRDPVAMFGQGMLTGGRGLPDGNKKPETTNRKMTPLDDLLSSLSKASNLDVEDVQEQLVEQVQIGDRTQLIKQKDLLTKLIQHPNAEVRRTAAWALGRANDLSLARYLVTALDDPDVDVDIEAHNALCWISRKPLGFDLQMDPLEGLPPDAGPDVKEAALKSWRTAAVKQWGTWYLKNRPYKDRGDEFEAQLREKLAGLQ